MTSLYTTLDIGITVPLPPSSVCVPPFYLVEHLFFFPFFLSLSLLYSTLPRKSNEIQSINIFYNITFLWFDSSKLSISLNATWLWTKDTRWWDLFPLLCGGLQFPEVIAQFVRGWNLTPGPLFTKRPDAWPRNNMKSRSRKIGCYNDHITLKFESILAALFPRCLSNLRVMEKPESPGFETSRDLGVRNPSTKWLETQHLTFLRLVKLK